MNSHETIDRFLNGSMNPDETTQFLNQVAHDSELQALLESDRIINSAIGKEKSTLMNHDLSSVAGAFVAGLASTGVAASHGLLTAAYAKKAGMSWITLTASTILSVSVCAGAYWYISTSASNTTQFTNPASFKKSFSFEHAPIEMTLKVPSIIVDKLPMKSIEKKTITPISKSADISEPISEKPQKIRLEHSLSKYRPKSQE